MDERPSEERHLPVLASAPDARVIERTVEPMPLSAPVAAATSGVLAGLAAMALVKAVRGGSLGRRGSVKIGGRRGKLKVAQSHSFLVDVHLLKR
ncbi:MAG: hypothetical protein QOC95_335 [Thermoleophilaceae bacterium]|jgi:hypothetical protein|nr:hypothetical protein [Thermoleophilaceae bacterium]